MIRSPVSAAAVLVLASSCALAIPGCSQTLVTVQGEAHPNRSSFLVTAALEEWPRGYYSTPITIRNLAADPLPITPSMFRLEGTGATSFVQAGHMPLFMGRAGYRMPPIIAPRTTARGEIFFGIRGTKVPAGPIRLIVTLPDGEHSFEFELIQ